jgi:sugar phosphate isomerase/epimerase
LFRLAYNTNGLAHHRLLDALELLAELGYEGVAITPDVGQLDPWYSGPAEVRRVRDRADELGLALSIETGARFVMDARRKHFPTLLEDEPFERDRRVEFLMRCTDLAADLGADVVSFWAGAAPEGVVGDWPEDRRAPAEPIWDRLCAGVERVLAHGAERGIELAFEPEPGMFVATVAGFEELRARLGSAGESLGLCLDVGHLLCTGEEPAEVIRRCAANLRQVHLDDIADGVHEHRMFGTGSLDLRSTLQALLDVGYRGLAAVELSRDSHRGAAAAAEALEHLRRALTTPPS